MTRDQVEGNLLTEEEEEEEEEEEAECIQIGCSGGRERNTALAAALPAAPSLSLEFIRTTGCIHRLPAGPGPRPGPGAGLLSADLSPGGVISAAGGSQSGLSTSQVRFTFYNLTWWSARAQLRPNQPNG